MRTLVVVAVLWTLTSAPITILAGIWLADQQRDGPRPVADRRLAPGRPRAHDVRRPGTCSRPRLVVRPR